MLHKVVVKFESVYGELLHSASLGSVYCATQGNDALACKDGILKCDNSNWKANGQYIPVVLFCYTEQSGSSSEYGMESLR